MTPLTPKTQAALDAALPPASSHANPVDLLADASPARYVTAVESCLADPHIHGIVAMLAPQAFSQPLLTARGLIGVQQRWDKVLLACFVGEELVRDARTLLVDRGIPEFPSPEAAVEAFGYLARHERNRQLLLQAPGPLGASDWPDAEAAEQVVTGALARRASRLAPDEAGRVLGAYGVPLIDVASWRRPDSVELHLRVLRDKIFGPVIRFGLGQSEDSPIREHFVGLPPLHMGLVQAMLRDTATEASLSTEQLRAVQRLVCDISELVSARPELTELHLRPVLVDERGGVAGSATMLIAPLQPGATRFGHMAIHPYPGHLQWSVTLKD